MVLLHICEEILIILLVKIIFQVGAYLTLLQDTVAKTLEFSLFCLFVRIKNNTGQRRRTFPTKHIFHIMNDLIHI